MKIEEIKLIVSKQIQVGKNEIKSNLRSHGKVVSGRTLRSLRSETTNTPTTVTGRIWSTVSYFPVTIESEDRSKAVPNADYQNVYIVGAS